MDLRNWREATYLTSAHLSGRTVCLAPMHVAQQASDLFRANAVDDAMWTYLPYGPFSSEAGYHRWMREAIETDGTEFFAVQCRETSRCIGVLSYLNIVPDHGSVEIGHVAFSKALQQTTGATEAVYLLMKHAFEAGYRRVEWKCDASNIASRRAAQRFGFSFEGVFRQHRINKGINRDTAYFAVIDAEWPALNEAFAGWLSESNFDAGGKQRERLGNLTALVRAASDPIL